MPHYLSMYDSDYLHHYDFPDGVNEIVAVIEKVEAGELVSQGGRKTKKPVVYFQGKQKGLALNKTNGRAVASMYGTKTEQWVGMKVTMYKTTTSMAGETVECIRIKNTVPK